VLQAVQAIIEKVQIQDVLAGHSRVLNPLHELEHEGRFAASAYSDADRGLSRYVRDIDSPEHACRKINLLKIQDYLFKDIDHGFISGFSLSG
jgi:hypothetical protein